MPRILDSRYLQTRLEIYSRGSGRPFDRFDPEKRDRRAGRTSEIPPAMRSVLNLRDGERKRFIKSKECDKNVKFKDLEPSHVVVVQTPVSFS